jgi:tRNA C32,U32 (ribose-2'-O)-methylase TrmJ
MTRVRIALYQPDIPQNTGTILRLCACLGLEAHIIEPAGFPVTDRAFRRAGMDYLDAVQSSAIAHGTTSRRGEATSTIVSCCSPPPRRCPISITATGRTTCCCSAANPPACRKRCTRRPMRA